MARAARNPRLETRTARLKLGERREPYWSTIAKGCSVGYRRGAKGGTWIARFRGSDGKQKYESLGASDDLRDPDNRSVFSFGQAQEKAREFFHEQALRDAGEVIQHAGPYTVAIALDEYFKDRERKGSKGIRADRYVATSKIRPALGSIEIHKLKARQIKDWRHDLEMKGLNGDGDADKLRARRATSNRILTVLKAALNHAFAEGKAPSDMAWRQVKPHREVDVPLVRYLSTAECVRLVNASEGAFRTLLRGALVTGARYGELGRMKVRDFNLGAGIVTVGISKGGKPRHIALNEEGQRLFVDLTAGRGSDQLVFARDDGEPWGPSHQQRPIEEASRRAKIVPSANFHMLRHTYASALAMKGVSMRVIAEQLGHADTRITERHYAHLAPSYVADVVRAASTGFGIVPIANVHPI